jgi:beta-lactamase class A
MQTPLARALERIETFRQAHPGSQVWACARNLETGARFGLGEKEPVRTASTIKLPILCALLEGAKTGRWRLEDPVEMREEDKVSGSGVIRELSAGTRFSLRDLANLMIVVSDNTATNLILDRISADFVNDCLAAWGFTAIRSMRKIMGDGKNLKAPTGWSRESQEGDNKRFGIGRSSMAEMVRLLETIERGEMVSTEASREIIATLKRQQYKDGIGRRLDAVMPVASKSGALDALRSDVGIVYAPSGRMAVAVTVDGMPKVDYSPDNPGNVLIADLTDVFLAGLSK